jgi:WD40 repeat protein
LSPDQSQLAACTGDGRISLVKLADGSSALSRGQRGEVSALDVSADGSRIAVGGADGLLRLLGSDGGRQAARPPESQPISAARFSPTGDRLAYAVADGTLRLCDREGAEVASSRCPGEPRSVAWNPSGDRILVACGRPEVQLWNPSDGSPTAMLAGQEQPIVAADWSSKALIATGDARGRISLWSEAGQLLRPVSLRGGGPVLQVRLSPDGRWFSAIDSDRRISVWPVDGSGEPLYLEAGHEVASLAWSPDAATLVAISFGGEFHAWDTQGKLLVEARPRSGRATVVAWLPGTQTVWIGCEDATLHAWDMAGRRAERSVLLLAGGQTAAFTASGRVLTGAELQAELLYGVETESGGLALLAPAEFQQRYELP